MCGLRTRRRTDVDPPRVELSSAKVGAYRLAAAGATTCLICFGQLFGQEASEFPVLSGYYRRQNESVDAAAATPAVEHTVHTALDFPDFDVVAGDLEAASQPQQRPPAPPPPPRRRVYHSYPAAPASLDEQQQQQQQDPAHRRGRADDPTPTKTADRLTAEINLEKTRFVPVPAALVDQRREPGAPPESAAAGEGAGSTAGEQRAGGGGSVGRRRLELAKEGVDSLDYVESFADIQVAPDDKFVFMPTGRTLTATVLFPPSVTAGNGGV